MADISLIVDYKQVKQANQEILKIGSSAQKSASVFQKAFSQAERSQKTFLSGVQQQMMLQKRLAAQQTQEANKSLSDVRKQIALSKQMEAQKGREAAAAAKAAQDISREEDRLRNKYVQGHAAMSIYSRELNDLAMARKKDIISADQQKQAVAELNMAMAKGTGAFAAMGTAAQVGGRRMSGTGMAIQQTGYQVGDFLVQVQGGTNVLVAFGQQATQLVGVLPMVAGSFGLSMKAAIGLSAGLGIAIPLLTAIGAYFMRAGKAGKKSAEDIQGAFKVLPDFFEGLSVSISKPFVQAFNEIEIQYGAMFARLAEIKLRDTKEALSASFTSSVTEPHAMSFLDRFSAALAPGMVQGSAEASQRVRDENRQLLEQNRLIRSIEADYLRGVDAAQSRQELIDLTTRTEARLAVVSEEAADSFAKQAEELGIVSSISEDAVVAQEKTSKAAAATALYYAQMYTQLNESQIAGQKLAEEMYQAFLNGEKLHEIDLEGGVNAAALAAGRLAQELGISLASAAEMVRLQQTMVYSGRGSGPQGVISGQFQPDDKLYKDYLESLREAKKKGPTSETGQEALDKLVRQVESRRRLVGLTEEQARYEELLFKIQETNASKRDPLSQKELEAAAQKIHLLEEQTRVIEEQTKAQEALADQIASTFGDGFTAMVDGTKSVKDAFKDMARAIIKDLYEVYVMQQIVGSAKAGTGIAGAIGRVLANADGNAFSGGRVTPFANGGVVGGPTYFPMSGGKTGLMGEAGPEAIMPLKRGANGKLGVSVEGGSGSVVVNNNINVTGGSDPAAIRMEVAKLMPQITSATKSAVIDARRRGGQMRAAFN